MEIGNIDEVPPNVVPGSEKLQQELSRIRDNGNGFWDISDLGLGSQRKLRITITPSREVLKSHLQTDIHQTPEEKAVARGILAHPNLQRVIQVDILGPQDAICATSELHLIDEDGKLVAIDPHHRLSPAFATDYSRPQEQGGKSIPTSERIATDYPSQLFTNSFLVDRNSRGQGLGRILFDVGNLLAKGLGAEKRVVWSSTPGAAPFYVKSGAHIDQQSIEGNIKSVPIVNL